MKQPIFAGLFLFALLISSQAQASTIRMCATWPYTYKDSDRGEDYLLPAPGGDPKNKIGYATVPYAAYRLYKGGETVKKGRLDASGCVLLKNVDAQKTYELRIIYNVQRDDGRGFAILSPKSEVWEKKYAGSASPKIVGFSTQIYLGTESDEVRTYNFSIPNDQYSRLVVVASHALSRFQTLNWKENGRIHFAVNNTNLCKPGQKAIVEDDGGVKRLCFEGSAVTPKDQNMNKTPIAHEIGHAIARMNGGPRGGDYKGDRAFGARVHDPLKKIYCRNGLKDHVFHTREWVGTAANEGFAHFVAAATFNARFTDGRFKYYKLDAYTTDAAKKPIKITKTLRLAPDSNGMWQQFTDTACRPPTAYPHLGSEGDWLFFFWGLWTGASNVRYNISEINEIWANTSSKASDIDVYCVPRSTRVNTMTNGAVLPGYEEGWTCKNKKWQYVSHKMIKKPLLLPGGYIEVLVPDEKINSHKSKRGASYGQVEKVVSELHSGNSKKITHFIDTALNAKIVY